METKPFNNYPPINHGRQNGYNQSQPGATPKKSGNNNAVGMAGAGVAGAALGAVAGFAASQFVASATDNDENLIEPEIIDQEETVEEPVEEAPVHPQPQPVYPEPAQPAPQPVQSQPEPQPDGEMQPIGGQSPQTPEEMIDQILNPTDGSVSPTQPEQTPDEVADAIIAEELVDPNDIDSEEVFDFAEIGTVTTIEGDEMTVATFTTGDGEQYAMVDVNMDGNMDVIVDSNGNEIGDAIGYTTDDIVERLTAPDTYIAANDTDIYDPSIESQMQGDMIV